MTAQHRSHRLARALAAGVAAAALAAPVAVARPIDSPHEPVAGEPEQPVVVQKLDDGFDWGSAAVGAGGAGALAVVVALGGVAYTTRRRIGVAR